MPAATADPRKSTFAELIVPKTTAYVGEMIPIVVRVGFELQTRVRNIPPELDLPGQGFTKQKMRASEARQTIGEKTYNIITYKTAIAAARTGTIRDRAGRNSRRRAGSADATEPAFPAESAGDERSSPRGFF